MTAGIKTQLTPNWSSQLAVYLGTIGAAVGLGSIWRFPYLAGSLGGGTFIGVFVLACLIIATPLLVAEYMIGRYSGLAPSDAAGAMAVSVGRSRHWNIIGQLGTITHPRVQIPQVGVGHEPAAAHAVGDLLGGDRPFQILVGIAAVVADDVE